MTVWFDPFFALMTMPENAAIESDDVDAPNVQEQLKAEISRLLKMAI